VAAGLLMRSLLRVLDIDLGFRPDSAIALRIDPGSRYAPEQRHAYVDDALRLVRAIPGVQAAGLADVLPLDGNRSWAVVGKGQVYPAGGYPEGFVRVVSEGYLDALGLGLLAGRDFSADDTPTSEPVAVVNETLARTLWPGQDPLRQIVMTEGPQAGARRVVGVVRDVRHRALERDAGLELYLPMRQRAETGAVFLVVRSTIDAGALTASIRTALAPIAPDVPANQVRVMQDLVDRAVSPRRFLVVLVAGFAAFAVVLASLGIYAVVAYFVSQRHQEFGIRLALGASPSDVQARVLRQTLGLAGVGLTVGVAVSLMLTDVLSGQLFGVTAADPATFFGMAVILGLVSAAAGYIPARRASRLDPMHAIRGQ
jgi:predicted permease